MIALLFALLAIAMVLAWADHWRWSFVLFAVVLLMSIYWLDFYATTPLKIIL